MVGSKVAVALELSKGGKMVVLENISVMTNDVVGSGLGNSVVSGGVSVMNIDDGEKMGDVEDSNVTEG